MEENEKVVMGSEEKTCYSKNLCITALVLGISSLVLCWIPILNVILAIVGLVISIVANKKRSEHNEDGKGFVITGLVCSILGIVLGIILSIVLALATSVYIYHSANATIKTSAAYMSPNDKNVYNSVVENYSNKGTLNGSDVMSMIDDIITQNSQYVDETGKFISIDAQSIAGYSDTDLQALHKATKKANVYEDADGDNTQTNIDKAKNEYTKLRRKISSGKKYVITTKEKDGIIYSVTIAEKQIKEST